MALGSKDAILRKNGAKRTFARFGLLNIARAPFAGSWGELLKETPCR